MEWVPFSGEIEIVFKQRTNNIIKTRNLMLIYSPILRTKSKEGIYGLCSDGLFRSITITFHEKISVEIYICCRK